MSGRFRGNKSSSKNCKVISSVSQQVKRNSDYINLNTSGSSESSSSKSPNESQKHPKKFREDEIVKMSSNNDGVQNEHESMEDMMTRLLIHSEERTASNIREVIKEEIAEQFSNLEKAVEMIDTEVQAVKKSLQFIENSAKKCNIVVLGLPENANEDAANRHEAIRNLAKSIKIGDIDYSEAVRLGKFSNQKPRPLLIKLLRYRDKIQIKMAAKNLKGTKIYIKDDLTVEERHVEGILRKKKREIMDVDRESRCRIRGGKLLVRKGTSTTTYVADLQLGMALKEKQAVPISQQMEIGVTSQ